jgi:hypothetical protein
MASQAPRAQAQAHRPPFLHPMPTAPHPSLITSPTLLPLSPNLEPASAHRSAPAPHAILGEQMLLHTPFPLGVTSTSNLTIMLIRRLLLLTRLNTTMAQPPPITITTMITIDIIPTTPPSLPPAQHLILLPAPVLPLRAKALGQSCPPLPCTHTKRTRAESTMTRQASSPSLSLLTLPTSRANNNTSTSSNSNPLSPSSLLLANSSLLLLSPPLPIHPITTPLDKPSSDPPELLRTSSRRRLQLLSTDPTLPLLATNGRTFQPPSVPILLLDGGADSPFLPPPTTTCEPPPRLRPFLPPPRHLPLN